MSEAQDVKSTGLEASDPVKNITPRDVEGEAAVSAAPKSHLVFARLKVPRALPSKYHSWAMLGTLFLVMILAGWNDASQGPLLPALQAYYHVNYLVISIIWVINFLGFLTAGLTNVFITDRFGFGIAAPFGALMQGLGYILMCWGGPYPLFVIAYYFSGFGLGLQDAQVNALTSRLPNASTKMFLMHAVYGLGATISPLVSTEFVKAVSEKFYTYFAVSLGLAIMTAVMLILVFQFRTEDQVVGVREADVQMGERSLTQATDGEKTLTTSTSTSNGNEMVGGDVTGEVKEMSSGSGNKMKRIMKIPAVHFMAFYIMVYVGIEVTIGGWATSFIIDERGGNESAGYVTSGYFGGITLGRVVFIPVTHWIGGQNAIYVYSIAAIALEIVVWTVKNIIGDAVAFALVGLTLGPMYPIVMMVCVDILPGELQSGSIGWIASLGQAGSAIMPFITGAISERYGVWILQPLVISFIGLSLILWALVPRSRVRIQA